MGQILRDIYDTPTIAPILGFKGGTCAYFFYDLSRFSVDLDFDLFDTGKKELVANEIKQILEKYGKLTDFAIKEKTILFELSYEADQRRLKIEIATNSPLLDPLEEWYEMKEYFGISMLVASKEYMFSCKLVALTNRGKFTMRDVYDVWYFAKNGWPISNKIVQIYTGKDLAEYLADCKKWISLLKKSQFLVGLGDLLDEKDKNWVKNSLIVETTSLLDIYSKNV
ncbi:MAG: nucleotidyl transferase AbiEii/AbiGii toxin family protein [bacterium]